MIGAWVSTSPVKAKLRARDVSGVVAMLVAASPLLATKVGACVCGIGAALLDGEHAPTTVAVKAAKARSDRRTPQAYYESALPEMGWARSMTSALVVASVTVSLMLLLVVVAVSDVLAALLVAVGPVLFGGLRMLRGV